MRLKQKCFVPCRTSLIVTDKTSCTLAPPCGDLTCAAHLDQERNAGRGVILSRIENEVSNAMFAGCDPYPLGVGQQTRKINSPSVLLGNLIVFRCIK